MCDLHCDLRELREWLGGAFKTAFLSWFLRGAFRPLASWDARSGNLTMHLLASETDGPSDVAPVESIVGFLRVRHDFRRKISKILF